MMKKLKKKKQIQFNESAAIICERRAELLLPDPFLEFDMSIFFSS